MAWSFVRSLSHRGLRAILLPLSILVLLLGDAHAEETRKIIGVLDVRVEGVPADVASQFQNALESQLDSKRYWLSGRSKMKERMASSMKWVDGCLVGKCLFDIKTQTGAELVIHAAISGSGTSYGYVVTLLRTDVGAVVAQQSDRCDVCTLNEVMTNATLATIQLINAVPEKLPDGEAERHAAVELAIRPLQNDLAKAKKATAKGAIVLTVAGLVIGGVGAALYYSQDKPNYALAIAGGGGGMLVGGLTLFAF